MAKQVVVQAGDVTQRVGVEVIRARGVDVEKLIRMLVANAAAEFASTYYVCMVPLQDSVIDSTRNGGAELSRGLQQWPDFA